RAVVPGQGPEVPTAEVDHAAAGPTLRNPPGAAPRVGGPTSSASSRLTSPSVSVQALRAGLPPRADASRRFVGLDYFEHVELHQVGPSLTPAIEEGRIVGLHELEAALEFRLIVPKLHSAAARDSR
ncbi:MAG TPA: hypothetical protein VJ741_10175, partial [Solirubrobacteraceae bacterium]|nr:hypothetical protein [Solirubrobacteraceae bacterium]